MNKNKIAISILLVVLVMVVIWSINGILNIRQDDESYEFSVIVDDSYDESWLVTRKGFEQAAEDNDIIMNYVSTNKFESVEQQIEVINREISNGADGIIIKWISSDVDIEEISDIIDDKAIVVLDSDISTDGMMPVCGVDNYEYGKAVANQIIDNISDIENLRVGVLLGDESLVSTVEQLAGVSAVLEENGIKEKWIIYNSEGNAFDEVDKNIKRRDVDVILSVGRSETELAIDCLEQNNNQEILLYGAGYSKKNVYYLDRRVVDGLVVPDEFNKGYQSVQELARQMKYHSANTMKTTIGFNAVNYDTMYDADNEKLVFPIVK